MPLPFLAIAIPVLHSSGAWIASSAAGGYIAGTLASTWVGAFILGNTGLLGSLGILSGAGIFAAAGGSGLLATATSGAGAALTSVGLGGVATTLGIAPVATFLGLTPIGWAIAGTGTTAVGGTLYYVLRKNLKAINVERVKGGLEPTTVRGILSEVRQHEIDGMVEILRKLAGEGHDIRLSADESTAIIDGNEHTIRKLKYVVESDGSEKLYRQNRLGRKTCVILIKGPGDTSMETSGA